MRVPQRAREVGVDCRPGRDAIRVLAMNHEDERRVLAPGLAAFLAGLAPMLEVGRLTIDPREADSDGDDDESEEEAEVSTAPKNRQVVFFDIEPGLLQ